ncbi:cadherin-related family member 3 isoform X2 [Mesocricetus auratus]|uniref:Cadherin-related family member 3 isoform X2 n=1 Tax=Mesocricetus auratus TaxID=10036 RepID=A0ABM2XR60_MESAU|nr:cadherin-related family member 3 isoform X2 [Mesocricetus auratus]
MPSFHFLFILLAASGVRAALNFVVENAGPLLENASDHTRVATVTVSLSPHTSLVGEPVILNASPVVHPFVLSRRSSHLWDLFVTGAPQLDFEEVALYSLTIYAKDNHEATASQTIFVQIEDVNEPPTFTGSLAREDQVTEIYITEDTVPGTIIYKAVAKDAEDAVLEYFISPESASFTIDSTGAISTAAALDFERDMRSFSLIIKVVDPGGLFATGNLKIFLINVNNKNPTLTCSLFNIENSVLSVTSTNSTLPHEVNIILDEEIPIGKMIAMCQAADEDNLGDLTFGLETGDDYFAIDKEKGTVVTTSRLDVEKTGFASALSFSIKTCDGDQRCAIIPVATYVNGINDNSPFCDQYLIRYTGKEEIAKDTIIAKLTCHDLDKPPDTIHYAPSSGPVGSGQLFEQVPNAENFIQVTKELDYENPEVVAAGHIYEMMISVFDDLHPSHTAFYKVGQVAAVDEDHPPNCLTYKIINGDVQAVQRFWIHPFSGVIELTSQLDYESVRQYNLTVQAVDCDRAHPRTAVATVIVDIEDENDEAPVCIPYLYKAAISDDVVAGTNVNGLKLNCHDRDSHDFEMRFEIASGNKNLHFKLDPSRGTNTPKLIVKNPFNFESGADLQQQYHLVVHVIDDNLKSGKAIKPKTGTAVIDIYVQRINTPPPPTSSEQREGLTIVYTAINTYKNSDWYVPFIFTLMAVFFVGFVFWMFFLLWTYGNTKNCSPKMTKEDSKLKPKGVKYVIGDISQKEENVITETRNKKLEVLTEATVYETVFDGEAIDPVSGNMYAYNSRTGARKWKTLVGHQEEYFGNIYSLSEAHPLKESTSLKIPVQQQLL